MTLTGTRQHRSAAGDDLLPDDVHFAPFRFGIENQLIAVEAKMPNLLRADKIREPTSLNLMHHRLVDYINREDPALRVG